MRNSKCKTISIEKNKELKKIYFYTVSTTTSTTTTSSRKGVVPFFLDANASNVKVVAIDVFHQKYHVGAQNKDKKYLIPSLLQIPTLVQ